MSDQEEIEAAMAAFEQDDDYFFQEENDQEEDKGEFPLDDEMDEIMASVDLNFIENNQPIPGVKSCYKDVTTSAADDDMPPSQSHLDVLHEHFGHTSFRPMQWKIISAALKGRDNSVVMSTGYGKSLCYQFPAVYTRGVSVVISPLISLMEDQVLGLQASNIEACLLGSAQGKKQEIYDELLENKYRVIYATPEFVTGGNTILETIHKGVGITLFAIDEAHCVSQWGHDFRNAYRKLGMLRRTFPSVPIMALTATATPEVLRDITASLNLRSPVTTITSFDRPNLFLEVKEKSSSIIEDLRTCLQQGDNSGSTIIYCPTKKATEEVARAVNSEGVECAIYHAGYTPKQRRLAHEQFVRDKVPVIVATIAFGMGINKPDVRRVIHYGSPRDMESYYQEIGRAGRDGLPAVCSVYFANKDFSVHKYFLSVITNQKFREHRMEMQNKMEHYLSLSTCRRVNLLSHFTANPNIMPSDACCDNCSAKKTKSIFKSRVDSALDEEGKYDFTDDSKIFLNALLSIGSTSLGTLILFLRGSNSQRVKDFWKKFSTFGAGKARSDGYWKSLGKLLIFSNYVTEIAMSSGGSGRGRGWGRGRGGAGSSFSYFVISPTSIAKDVTNYNKRVLLVPSSDMKQELKYIIKIQPISDDFYPVQDAETNRQARSEASQIRSKFEDLKKYINESKQKEVIQKDPKMEKLQSDLYKSLLEVRNQLGEDNGFFPYMVASNRTILSLANNMPDTIEKLRKVEGMTTAKVQKFGEQFINHIVKFREKFEASFGKVPRNDEEIKTEPLPTTSSLFNTGWIVPQKVNSSMVINNDDFKIPLKAENQSAVLFKEDQVCKNENNRVNETSETSFQTTSVKNENQLSKSSFLMTENEEMARNDTSNLVGANSTVNVTEKGNSSLNSSLRPTIPQRENVPDLSIGSKPNVSESNSTLVSTSKIKSVPMNTFQPKNCSKLKRGGVCYDDDKDEDEDEPSSSDNNTQSSTKSQSFETSEEKYERIRLENKRKLEETGWINVKSMKNKVKKNTLFKR